MNPWTILGLSCTVDAREIKRAYAAKLKITKPDEKPEEFQQLHRAYKMALNHAKHGNSSSQMHSPGGLINAVIDSPYTDDDSLIDEVFKEGGELSELAVITADNKKIFEEYLEGNQQVAVDEARQEWIRNYQELLAKVQAVLVSGDITDDAKGWFFLTETPYLLEDEFNWNIGKEIFRLFIEYSNTQQVGGDGQDSCCTIPSGVTKYCDQLFAWRNNAYYLAEEFGEDKCNFIFVSLEEGYRQNDGTKGVRGGILIRGATAQHAKPVQVESENNNGNLLRMLYWGGLTIFCLFKLFSYYSSDYNNDQKKLVDSVAVISITPAPGSPITDDSVIDVTVEYDIENFSRSTYSLTVQFNTNDESVTTDPVIGNTKSYLTSGAGVKHISIPINSLLTKNNKKYEISRPFIFRVYLLKRANANKDDVVASTKNYVYK